METINVTYNQYCSFRLPCGVCSKTGCFCPFPNGNMPIYPTWVGPTCSSTMEVKTDGKDDDDKSHPFADDVMMG